jgi:hypothetical protein
VQDVEMHIVGEPIPIHDPDEPIDDFLFDEIAPDMHMHITGEEGFNYYAGQRFVPSIGNIEKVIKQTGRFLSVFF